LKLAASFVTDERHLPSSVYSAVINSLLEEYVWRWFVCHKTPTERLRQ
jgi:hypothetical protein